MTHHLFPFFVHESIEGSDETEQLHIQMTRKTWNKPLPPGFPQALEIMETRKIMKKCYMHGKIMEFEKKLNNHGKIMDFCEII